MSTITPPLPDAPYRGIEPFRFTDQQIFAARKEETWALLSNVTLYRAVLLYGASGTGKSSLINAGFLPEALKENYVPDRIRVQPFGGREIKVERIRTSSGEGGALSYLPSNFARAQSDEAGESIELSLAAFREQLEKFRLKPTETQSEVFRAPQGVRPILIFDQFEEFITLFEEAQRVGTSAETKLASEQVPAAQQDILTTLVELIQDETLPIKIIFSFREDYLAKLSLLFEYCPELLDQAQRLLPPTIAALPEIIRAPFTNPDLRAHFLEHGSGSEISEPLAQQIAAELGHRSEGDTANLTELQIVCQRLWHAPDAEKLFAADGIEGLLKSYGTDVFRHFTPALRDAAVVLLSHMITASNTRNIISEEDLLSRTGECDFEPAQCTGALTALSRSQIVRREPRHNIYFYEITSEYLVPWIKERVAERQSAEELRQAEEAQAKLEAQRAEAVTRFNAERRRGRLLRRLLTAMILLLVVSFALGLFGYRQYKRADAAEDAAAAAEKARDEAKIRQQNELIDAVELVSSSDREESLKGIQQIDTLIKQGQVPSDLKSVLIAPAAKSEDEGVRQAAYRVLTTAAQTDPELEKSIVEAAETSDALAKKLPPRFYVHYADDTQKNAAQQVVSALKSKGYVVARLEKHPDKDVLINQVRYFRNDEPGMPRPEDLAALLSKYTRETWRPRYLGGYEGKLRPGHFEIYFAVKQSASAEPARDPNSADPKGSDKTAPATGTLLLEVVDDQGHPLSGPYVEVVIMRDNRIVKAGSGRKFDLEEGDYRVSVHVTLAIPAVADFSIKANQLTTQKLIVKRLQMKLNPKAAPK